MGSILKNPFTGLFKGPSAEIEFAVVSGVATTVPFIERRKSHKQDDTVLRERIARASRAWQALNDDAKLAWQGYAELLTGPSSYERGIKGGEEAFVSYGARLLQIREGMPLPLLPPIAPFFGDAVYVLVATTAEAPDPQGAMGVRFLASGANAPGILTELLLQPLGNPNHKPRAGGYVSSAFINFSPNAHWATVAAPAGCYACAYRFVLEETGQATGIFGCGIVTVA